MDNDDLKVPTKELGDEHIAAAVLRHVPEDAASYYQLVPMAVKDGVLEVGMVDPDNMEARDALQFIASKSDMPFKIFKITAEQFTKAFEGYKGISGAVDEALEEYKTTSGDSGTGSETVIGSPAAKRKAEDASLVEEAPVTKIVGVILQHAIGGNASDIHIEPMAGKVRVRFRVDGILYTSLLLPVTVHNAVVSRIKILTNMKLDEKRKPQDGRFSAKVEGKQIDFRVSTLPTFFGEKVVIRILDPDHKFVTLETLGLNERVVNSIRNALKRPYGMILLTGPTGSGKTTTLYSMLNEIDKEKYNTVSLEDPIEYDITGVNQSQVQPEINYTFANGLRSILRQDPDIIMVGEIRDKETAKLAIQAALTGHLVLSTLHTNTAAGAIPRLIDMGVEPYLIPPTLNLVISQRLVPILCDSKQTEPLADSLKMMLDKELEDLPPEHRSKLAIPAQVYKAVPSSSCPSGTRGRTAAAEFFEMDKDLEKIVLKNGGQTDIYKLLRSKGFLSIREDAMQKAFAGQIAFEEVNKL